MRPLNQKEFHTPDLLGPFYNRNAPNNESNGSMETRLLRALIASRFLFLESKNV